MRSFAILLALGFLAVPLRATPPMPVISAQLEWRAPKTLVVVIDSQIEPHDAMLEVDSGADHRVVSAQAIVVKAGRTEFFATVHVDEPMQPVIVRVSDGGNVLAVTQAHLTRDANGATRFMTPQEIDAARTARAAAERKRADDARLLQMRARIRRLLSEGRSPVCSADAAPLWNRAVREELAEKAPPGCRD